MNKCNTIENHNSYGLNKLQVWSRAIVLLTTFYTYHEFSSNILKYSYSTCESVIAEIRGRKKKNVFFFGSLDKIKPCKF